MRIHTAPSPAEGHWSLRTDAPMRNGAMRKARVKTYRPMIHSWVGRSTSPPVKDAHALVRKQVQSVVTATRARAMPKNSRKRLLAMLLVCQAMAATARATLR